MELPAQLKNLYRHWKFHTIEIDTPLRLESLFEDKKLMEDISWFIDERLEIWRKKISGEKAPYTKDAVLSTYRFCNIFREFDRQTIEFHTLLNPLRDNFPLWLLNIFYCRMVARSETIQQTGLLSFDHKENAALYEKLMNSSRPRFGTPYVFPISTLMKSETPTREKFIAEYLPKVMNEVAKEIQTWKKLSVHAGLEKIIPIFGYNLFFLWTEVLIDVAYQYPEHIDLFAQFPIGPGSQPTMQRINNKKDPSLLVRELATSTFNTNITFNQKPLRLSAENWEGIGCEYRKYTNLKKGIGRKRLFKK